MAELTRNQGVPLASGKEHHWKAGSAAKTLATGALLGVLHRYLTLLAFRRPPRYG